MEKHKMSFTPAIVLILILKSVVGNEITSLDKRLILDNSVVPTEAYGDGEVVDPVSYPDSPPFFRRIEKVELSAPTSSKTETVDISPKLAVSDDEDIFWEVTKIPESKLMEGTVRSDYVDGNHPDLHEVITHDHVDKTTGHSAQSKRVKKILPPFDSKKDESVSESIGKRNTRNISKPKIIAIKVSDLKGINHSDKKVYKTEIPIEHSAEGKKNGYGTNEGIPTATTNVNDDVYLATGSAFGGERKADEEGTTVATTEIHPSTSAIYNTTNFSAGNLGRILNEGLTVENASSIINIQKALASGVAKAEMDEFSKSFTAEPQTKDVDVAPDWKNSKTTPLTEWNSTENYGESDLKIRNPEFLLSVSENAKAELDKMEQGETAAAPDELTKEDNDEEIHGIPLVPKEFGKIKEEGTTERSIWDFLRDRERAAAAAAAAAAATTGSTTPKAAYKNFDAENAEVEYETENFQHGYSNIEKHELPFSYSFPWLKVKDKTGGGSESKKDKKVVHSKINDFPSVLPANKRYVENNENVQISKDVSKLLKLSENENSVNGVTVSIVDSGTNHEDISRYGHRPSKWYLLLLTGNSTIVKLRRKDFTKYLKLNLAARLSVEYDDIKVNKVILAPPKVLVNISVFAPSEDIAEESQFDLKEKFEDKGEAPLYKLAKSNATLLELSGEEYHVVQFLSLQSQKPEAEAQKDSVPNTISLATKHDDAEFIVYTFIGSACACAVILTIFVSLSKYVKKGSDHRWPWKKSKMAAGKPNRAYIDHDEFNGISPAVIYSGGFPQIRGSWMSGVGSRNHPPANAPSSASSILKQYPGIELGMSPMQRAVCPELKNRSCDSPRHNKLQIYNSGANNLVLPLPPAKKFIKPEIGNARPLDVRIPLPAPTVD